jgi:hypothetical protein
MSFAVTGMLHLFICPPHASVLSRHLAFKAHSFGLPLHSPCHVLQMAIVLITCDAYSPVCLLYQLVLLLLFFFFSFSSSSSSSSSYPSYSSSSSSTPNIPGHLNSIRGLQHHNITVYGVTPVHKRQHHCEAIRIDRRAWSATQDKPTQRLEWAYHRQTGGDYTQVTRYLVISTFCSLHLRVSFDTS